MSVAERELRYIRQWRPAAVKGDSMAMTNVAAAYRILEKFTLAARWYQRAAAKGDGDSMVDWGYCLQHGIGVRRDALAAEGVYREAIACQNITDYGREEAQYHLAVLLLGQGTEPARQAAAKLLRQANGDGDYPQAQELLDQLDSVDARNICVCRRHLRPRLARRHCPGHGPRRKNRA